MYKIIYVCLIIFTSLYLIQAQNQISTPQQDQNDINALNYALTLEHLESAYYNQGQNTFDVQSFVNAGLPASAFTYLNLIRDHEAAHVSLLQSALGTNAVPPCTYNFTSAYSSVYAYIATARLLEETGVSAYDGAANTINSAAYLQTAATIATIEARHASYLNQLLSYIAYFNATGTPYSNISNAINTTYPYPPFPNAFDTALSPSAILTAAQSFILSCPANTTLPVIAFTLTPYTNFSNGYNSSVFNSSGQYISQLQFTNDNYVLNYSLSLELLGRAFYSVVATFTPAQFLAANFSLAVYNNVQLIIANELAHVNFLNTTLLARGAVPAVPCSYNIANVTNTVGNALAFARMLENMEVTAYDGAINRLTQYDLIQGAATIATVEARHGNYLNNVLNGTGVQTASVDATNDPSAILAIVAPYLGANCTAPVIPAVAYTLQQQFLANTNVPISGSSPPPVGASNTFTYSSPFPAGGSASSLKSFLSILL